MTKKRVNGSTGPFGAFSPTEHGRLSLEGMYAECRLWLARLYASEAAPPGELLKPVFGAGDPKAGMMLIGEAPGKAETEQGAPFVGKTLSAFLEGAGFSRDSLFITNAVKYRPYRLNPSGGKANRTPTRAELVALRELLLFEIAAVSPKIVVTLGNSPLFSLTGRADIGARHGVLEKLESGAALFPLYHPASLIYNPGLAKDYEKDMAGLRDYAAKHGF